MIESFIARRYFTGEENKEYNKLFAEVVGDLLGKSGDDVLPALTAKLLSGKGGSTRVWPSDDDVIDKAINRNVCEGLSRSGLRLMLERVELSQRSKKSEGTEINPGLQIEHVLPQSWSAHWPLEGKQIKFKDAKIERITFELARLKAWKFGARTEAMNADLRRRQGRSSGRDDHANQPPHGDARGDGRKDLAGRLPTSAPRRRGLASGQRQGGMAGRLPAKWRSPASASGSASPSTRLLPDAGGRLPDEDGGANAQAAGLGVTITDPERVIDPWAGYWKSKQTLTKAMKRLDFAASPRKPTERRPA